MAAAARDGNAEVLDTVRQDGHSNGGGLPNVAEVTSAADHAQSLVPPTPTTESTFATDHDCAFWATVPAS
jgi:hypothetical protein